MPQDQDPWVLTLKCVESKLKLKQTLFGSWELTDEEAEASVIAKYETRIAAVKRKVDQLTVELGLAKKTPSMDTKPSST